MAKKQKKAAKPAKTSKAKAPARKVAAKKAARAKAAPKKAAPKQSTPKKSSFGQAVASVTATIRKITGSNGAKKANGNGHPKPSSKPFGEAGKALDGVRILDFTHVQSGPT